MPMGSVLLRPQSLTVTVTRDDELVLALTDLMEAIARDAEVSREALEIVADEISTGMRDLVVSLEEPLRFVDGRIRNLFAPLAAPVRAFAGGVGDSAFDSVPGLLGAIRGVAGLFSAEQIVSFIRGLFEIVEEGLGLTGERLAAVGTDISVRIEDRCMQPLVDGDSDARAANLYEVGSCLRRLRLLFGDLGFPTLDVEVLLDGLRVRLETTGLEQIVDLITDFSSASEDVFESVIQIVRMISDMEIDVDVEVHSPSLGGGSSTEMTTGAKPDDPVAWYASWVAGETVKYPADTTQPQNMFENEWLAGYSYKNISREKMEAIARVSAWSTVALEMFMHSLSVEQGDMLSNFVGLGVDGVDLGLKLGGIKIPAYAYWIATPIYSVPASLEGYRGGDAYWATNSAGRLGEVVLYRRWTWLLREALLSTLTLINHDPEGFARFKQEAERSVTTDLGRDALRKAIDRHNNNYIEGVSYALAELGSLLLPLILSHTDRANYGMIGNTLPGDAAWKAVGGTAITGGFLYLGVLVTRVMAGEWPSDWGRYGRLFLYERIFGKQNYSNFGWGLWSVGRALVALFLPWVHQLIYLYLFTNGSTDGGRYGVDLNFNEIRFPGYPARTASPYLLPYAQGDTKQCVQGNLGIWSHFPRNPGGNQMYAYDFSHDIGTEVLCSRAGIIVTGQDTVADFTSGGGAGWNFVEVMHLIVDPTGAAGLPAMPAPAGSTFIDTGASAVGIMFPPYWSPASPLANVPLHSTATAAAFAPGATFSFLNPAVDRGVVGRTFAAGATFSDGSPIPANTVFAPDTAVPPPPGTGFPAGTTFTPGAAGTFLPVRGTYGVYGHGRQNFMTTIFGTSVLAQVRGRFVQQGQRIMLANSTGNSAYNHLHVHILGRSTLTGAGAYGIPFVYRNVEHTISNGIWKGIFYPSDGRPRSMTFYTSTNVRIP
jgi:hypothetical protein